MAGGPPGQRAELATRAPGTPRPAAERPHTGRSPGSPGHRPLPAFPAVRPVASWTGRSPDTVAGAAPVGDRVGPSRIPSRPVEGHRWRRCGA
ncbi:hypothetical protein NMD1_04221 [Novosphingobium sp. MD-1]|nr:hypothetical protein NMD1_04221 [Novosphingobium sp. MD-1]